MLSFSEIERKVVALVASAGASLEGRVAALESGKADKTEVAAVKATADAAATQTALDALAARVTALETP